MPKKAKTYEEAVEIALESYPDTLERITESTIPAFYSRNMREQNPRKLPIIYFTSKKVIFLPGFWKKDCMIFVTKLRAGLRAIGSSCLLRGGG